MLSNERKLYMSLREKLTALQPKAETEQPNQLPENFNQVGWDLTIEKLEVLIAKLKELREKKGKRLTPPYYQYVYNRALIGINESDKLLEKLTIESASLEFLQAENLRMMAEIQKLEQEQTKKDNKQGKNAKGNTGEMN